MTDGRAGEAEAELPPRMVTLVLCHPDGEVLGALEPFSVAVPWWQEAAPVVAAAREERGVEVTILRLLESAPMPRCAGGPVTYLAELQGRHTDPAHRALGGRPDRRSPAPLVVGAARRSGG